MVLEAELRRKGKEKLNVCAADYDGDEKKETESKRRGTEDKERKQKRENSTI